MFYFILFRGVLKYIGGLYSDKITFKGSDVSNSGLVRRQIHRFENLNPCKFIKEMSRVADAWNQTQKKKRKEKRHRSDVMFYI